MGLFSSIFGGGDSAPEYQFKPTTVTSGTGTANYNPATGSVSASLNPQLQQLQSYFYNQALGNLPNQQDFGFGQQVSQYGQGLFGQAANMNTGQMARDYYNQQQSLLAEPRAAEEARLAETLFRTGRTGAAQGVQGGYVNPEQFALLKAREGQNAQLALGSEDRARQIQADQLKQALGYYGAGQEAQMSPYAQLNQILGYGTGIGNIENTLLGNLQNFGQLTNQAQGAQYNAALNSYNANNSGGIFGTLLSGLGSGLGAGLGGPLGAGLGKWAGSLFSSTTPATSGNASPGIQW